MPLRSGVAALTAVLVLLPAAPSQAYKLGGQKWPTKTITYYANAPQYNAAIKAAVAAWNGSGVNIRFKPASKGKAALQIIYGAKSGGPSGHATLGWTALKWTVEKRAPGGVQLIGDVRCGTKIPLPNGKTGHVTCHRVPGRSVTLDRASAANLKLPFYQRFMEVVVAHELGHTLGLNHVTKPCSVMNYGRDEVCPRGKPWQYRCRLLERDDVAGAIRRYGGHARALATEFCDQRPAPVTPAAYAAVYDPTRHALTATWAPFAGDRVVVEATKDACAPTPTDGAYFVDSERGTVPVFVDYYSPGRYCVSAWTRDEFDRLSAPAAAWVDVT